MLEGVVVELLLTNGGIGLLDKTEGTPAISIREEMAACCLCTCV